MNKVSKNIKKLRYEKNLTQEDIAKELFVTRQTVSSWESGRTQPDIETLVKLSEIFSVSTEELIYGKTKLMSSQEKENASRQKLIIIFSVIGAVLTGIGLILIFVNYWDKMPLFLKSVFAFVPMMAGQAAAVYTFNKKRESVPWCEGASVLWCAGVTATIALMDSIHMFMTDFSDCLFIDILLTLPMIFILDAVTPLLFIHSGINYLLIENIYGTNPMLLTDLIILALFAVALVYVIINREKKEDARHIFSQWISFISFSVITITNILVSEAEEPALWIMLTTYFAAVYFAFYSTPYKLPYSPLGLLGTLGLSVASVFFYHPDMMSSPYYGGYTIGEKIKMIIFAVLCIIIIILTGILKRKSISKNKIGIIFFSSTVLLILSQALCCIVAPENNHMLFYFLTLIASYTMAFTVTADGVLSNNFIIMNLGLIAIAINLTFMIINIIDISMLGAGILLLLFGIALFTVNFLLARKIKKTKGEINNA